jgi:predicted amidohydrolase YtcJ
MLKKITWVLALFSIWACKPKVDLIVHNAIVYDAEDTTRTQEAFAVLDGKILSIGSDRDILGSYSSDQLFDAQKKAITPGLADAHCHFYGQALFSLRANLFGLESWEKTVEKVSEFASGTQGWVRGRGWDQNLWTPAEFPDNQLLDKAFPDRPVLLTRVDGHAAIANSWALKLSGITAQTVVEGGKIVVKNGKPTGLLIDNAVESVERVIPAPDRNQIISALLATEKQCFSLGLTSLQDMGLDRATLEFLDSLYQNNILKIRLYSYALPSDRDWLFKRGKIERENFSVKGFKVYADGALGSRGACLIEPYSDEPTNHGLMLTASDSLSTWFEQMQKNDFQVATHCIGDSAFRLVMGLYRKVLSGSFHRWRIEHAQVIHSADLPMLSELGVLASVQPTHTTSDMVWASQRLGKRIATAYRLADLLKQSGVLPLGSDFPVEDLNPLFGFHAAVARQNKENLPKEGFQIENALSRNQALLGMTKWAAFAVHQENVVGSLKKGMRADFVVFQENPMTARPQEIRSIKIHSTYLNGLKVYQSVN